MSEYIKRIRTVSGDKQIDYTALANLPTLVTVDNTLTESGKAADAKIVGEKLAEVKQNSDVKYANILKGHAEGEVVRVDDVSSIEHRVNVKVTCPDGVDPSTVIVTRCSKNVIQSEKIANVQWKNAPNYTVNGVTWTASDDREITVQGETPEANYSVYDIATGERFTSWLKDGETYTASINQTGSGSIDLIVDVTDNETGKIVTYIRDGVTFTVDKTKYTYGTFRLQINPSTVVNAVVKPQIELGEVATAFEPHNGKTYKPNADGTLIVDHLYPTMTVFANTDNTTIECEYNQDTNAVIKKLTDAIVALGGTV